LHENNWYRQSLLPHRSSGGGGRSENRVRSQFQQFLCKLRHACSIAPAKAVFDADVVAVGPAEFCKSSLECCDPITSFLIGLLGRNEKSDSPHPFALLRRRCERPRRRAAEQRDEIAAFHCAVPPVLVTRRIAHSIRQETAALRGFDPAND